MPYLSLSISCVCVLKDDTLSGAESSNLPWRPIVPIVCCATYFVKEERNGLNIVYGSKYVAKADENVWFISKLSKNKNWFDNTQFSFLIILPKSEMKKKKR